MTSADMKVGGRYNWKYQGERLIYLGKDRCWHQFAEVEIPDVVWCEILDEELDMMEES